MTEVLVIGAGVQRGPVSIRTEEPGIPEILVGDIDLDLARQEAERVVPFKFVGKDEKRG